MPLPGKGFLAIWNDTVPGGGAEWLRWHTREHLAERRGVTGFLGARRYVDPARTVHRHFTLYPGESVATFSSPPYLERLNNPTPWTTRTAPLFSNFMRGACRTAASAGTGLGGVLATLRLEIRDAVHAADAAYASALVAAIAGDGHAPDGILGAHLGLSDAHVTGVPTRERSARGAIAEPTFDAVLLVEATDRTAIEAAQPVIRQALGHEKGPFQVSYEAMYSLEIALS